MKNIPKKIYLQIPDNEPLPDDFNEICGWKDLTWCQDRINDNDIEYVSKSSIVTKIDKNSVGRFIDNINNKKDMVCFVYYDFKFEEKTKRLIDIAKIRYTNNGFSIGCRGISYLDDLFLENINKEAKEDIVLKIVLKYVHAFIEYKLVEE